MLLLLLLLLHVDYSYSYSNSDYSYYWYQYASRHCRRLVRVVRSKNGIVIEDYSTRRETIKKMRNSDSICR